MPEKKSKEEKTKTPLELLREEISNQIAQTRSLITNTSADYLVWIERRDDAKKQLEGCNNNVVAHKANLDKLRAQEDTLKFSVNKIDEQMKSSK